MDELVKYIACNLVDKPDEVSVTVKEAEEGESIVLVLHVSSEDMGKVIGKQGRIAKAIRRIVKAAAVKQDKNYVVEIV